jgi:hypothetical protein
MFFSINKLPQENFSHYWQLGNFAISTDAGWHLKELKNYSVVFKGYLDDGNIEDSLCAIVDSKQPLLTGNFCALALNQLTGQLLIKSDIYRSFPIYISDSGITNLVPASRTAWTDNLITVNPDFSIIEEQFDVIGSCDATKVSTVDDIDRQLTNKFLSWKKFNQLPIRVFLSGGIDTLLVYSYLKKLNIDHEIVWNSHIDHDDFWLANHGSIINYWGYTQIHHWKEPCVLVTGAPGDEFMLRGPTTSNLYLMHHGLSILQLLASQEPFYHRDYFSLDKHVVLLGKQMTKFTPYDSDSDMIWNLCNINVNDWQHWHLGNTLTFTPLRDLTLFKMFLNLPLELAKKQIMDSTVSQMLIEKNVPGLTTVLSDQKNTANYMKNLRSLLR